MTYRKIGGIHWLRIGIFQFAFCISRKRQSRYSQKQINRQSRYLQEQAR